MRLKSFLILLTITALANMTPAHPLGNFTVNQYGRLDVGKTQIKIRQVLDMAEIPTFQESSRIDVDRDGTLSDLELEEYASGITPGFVANLRLSMNDRPLSLTVETVTAELGSGSGNLATLRVSWNLVINLPVTSAANNIVFENRNFSERIGWNEIVVGRENSIKIYNSTAYGNGLTDELKAYPQESLAAPLGERSAKFSFTSGTIPEGAAPLRNRDGQTTAAVQKDKLAELISIPEATPLIIAAGLLLAFGLGALHAMSPGHGKTVVGAYLVGSKGTAKHAAFLGLTVTITHTLGVFALGLITLFASSFILPERIIPILSFVSGLLVFYTGITLFKGRLSSALGWNIERNHHHGIGGYTHSHKGHSHDEHSHTHESYTHTHDGQTHTHLPPEHISWRSLLALGVSGGLLPCPSALVLMLAAISLNRVGYGLVLTLAFSFGLAATLTAVGFAFLLMGKLFERPGLAQSRIVKTLPVFSAFVIACLGAAICYNSL